MRYLFFAVFASALFFITSIHAAEVLIVTWQGKTVGETSFERRLKKLQPNVQFKYLDAGRNKAKLTIKLQEFDFSNIDLVYSYGTTGTKIVKGHLKGRKPHVFSIVSTPLRSKIVKSLDKPGENITGAKLLVDLEQQLKFLKKIKDYKTLGIWFDPREVQSQAVVEQIFRLCRKWGVQPTRFRFIPDAGKVEKTLGRLTAQANKLEALYVIGSSSYTKYYERMFKDLDPKLLVMGSVFRQVGLGATVALASSYEERGASVAELAHKILSGEDAGSLPVNVIAPEKATLYVDPHKIEAAGLHHVNALGVKIVQTTEPFSLRLKKKKLK